MTISLTPEVQYAVTGSSSQETHTLVAGTPLHIKARLKLATAGQDHGIILGTQTSGYGLHWNGTTNAIELGKWASGTFTGLKTVATVTQDTSFHSWQLTVVPGASTHTLQGSIDGKIDSTPDGTIALTTGTWNHTIHGPSTMEGVDIVANGATPHYYSAPPQFQTAVDTSGRHTGTIYDGINSRLMSDLTGTVLLGGGIDLSSSKHINRIQRGHGNAEVEAAVNSDSSLVHAPISGMRINTDGSIGGLPASTWSLSNGKYSAGTCLVLTCDVKLGTASGQIAIAVGNPGTGAGSQAFYLTINNGACSLHKIVSNTDSIISGATVNNTITVLTSTYYRLRLAVDFAQEMVEAYIEDPVGGLAGIAYMMLPASPTWPSFPNSGVNIALYDSAGNATFDNVLVMGREPWLNQSIAYQRIANPVLSGSPLQAGVVDAQAIATGAIDFSTSRIFLNKTLDNVSDGARRFAVASVNASNLPDHIASTTTIGPATITFGTGAPTSSQPQGSIYIRTDGSAGNRLYYRTGVPSWVAATSP